MDTDDVTDTVRLAWGIVISGAYVYLAYLSLQENFTLTPVVSASVFLLVVALLFGSKTLTELVEAWRGGGN